MKKYFLNPQEWREKHAKCEFCKYLRYDCTATRLNIPGCNDYQECIVKKKIIKFPELSRFWCRCYEAKLFTKESEKYAGADKI